jgi:hypothetical protein
MKTQERKLLGIWALVGWFAFEARIYLLFLGRLRGPVPAKFPHVTASGRQNKKI